MSSTDDPRQQTLFHLLEPADVRRGLGSAVSPEESTAPAGDEPALCDDDDDVWDWRHSTIPPSGDLDPPPPAYPGWWFEATDPEYEECECVDCIPDDE